MMRMRFHLATIAAALGAGMGALPAHAQSSARIDDIQVSREGETVSILVKLSQQPAAASARASGDELVIEIDGVELSRLALDPPAGSLVRHVDAAGGKMTLSGAAFSEASTVIYRNAVLIAAKLAEPEPRGASLMAAYQPAQSVSPAAAPKPATVLPVSLDKPIDLTRGMESRPASVPAAPAPAASTPRSATKASVAELANIDAARCLAAARDVEKDPWAIMAVGDHALCLLDQGKTKEASNRLEQLAAFAPEDWRVALGQAALAVEKGDAGAAESGYRKAASLAPSEAMRAAIESRIVPAAR